jgi:hypothetical protein
MMGERKHSSIHSLTSALDGGEWSASRPGRFTPRQRDPGTHWMGEWVGPRAVLDAMVKKKIPSHSRESNPGTPIVHPVAKSYTDNYPLSEDEKHSEQCIKLTVAQLVKKYQSLVPILSHTNALHNFSTNLPKTCSNIIVPSTLRST